MEDQPLISYKNVDINQQELGILNNVNFELKKGEFVYLIGKVGTGKSTFLKTIYGELDICEGEATVLGYDMRTIKQKNIASLRRKLGIVFQDFQLLTDRTVYDNLDFVLRATGWKQFSERESRIEEVLRLVGMENKGYKMPNELSGGEQQRIVIARAILNKPEIILADEPTGALDSNSSRMLLTMLTELNEQLAATILMVTHDAFSASYCHRILFIKDGQLFNELHRGTDTRKDFFAKILEVVSVLGGEQNDLI